MQKSALLRQFLQVLKQAIQTTNKITIRKQMLLN